MKIFIFKNVSPIRTKTMSAIRSRDTSIERTLRKAMFSRGYRYRICFSGLPGKPDIVLRKPRIAIFCDSDFWHGRNWAAKRHKIKNNRKYWIAKIERNIRRDRQVNKELCALSWTVLRFWEKDINSNLEAVISKIAATTLIKRRLGKINPK